MVRVSGPLVNVTTSSASVRDVQVHTKTVRAWGDGLMTPDPSQATLSNGAVEFEAAPGPVVMVLFMAEAGAETVSLVVGEGATQSLADAYRDGQMASDRDAGELAGILEQIRGSVGASAEARAGAEAAAEDAAGSAVSAGRDADRAETAAGEAATEAAGLAADAVRLEVKGDADRSAAGATMATEKAAEAAGSATRAETAETGAVEAEEGAEAGQELSEDAAAVAVAAAIGVQTAFHQYTGVGFPEGRVSAPVGAVYTDTAATNGALRWIKTSGTGATGWRVEYGDTGWRDVSSFIEDRMSPLEFTDGARLLVRRIGDLAYLKISGRVYVRSEFGRLCDNFAGFRPEGYAQVNFSKAADINAGVWQIRVESGTVDGGITSGADRAAMGYWDVSSPWPSTLPGIPS